MTFPAPNTIFEPEATANLDGDVAGIIEVVKSATLEAALCAMETNIRRALTQPNREN